jgi:hypothetical protein
MSRPERARDALDVKITICLLRSRMIDEMKACHFAQKVQIAYIRHARSFAAFLGRSPETATCEDLRVSRGGEMRRWCQDRVCVRRAARFDFSVSIVGTVGYARAGAEKHWL